MWNLRCRPDACGALLLLVVTAAGSLHAAPADVAGSRDPLGLERVADAWIVSYLQRNTPTTQEFVVGRVDKQRRIVRLERSVRTQATLESATYQMDQFTRRDEVIDHYEHMLGPSAVFSCSGRDCGRSNDWANQIFREAILVGPDRNQFYLAAEHEGHLVSVYVIERDNKRIYAHVRVLKPQDSVAVARNAELVERLSRDGVVVLDGVRPAVDGTMPAAALDELDRIAVELERLSELEVYVVCHLYGSRATNELLRAAERCSEAAVERLRREQGPRLEPFAAGPLLPRLDGSNRRLELVLPERLQRD